MPTLSNFRCSSGAVGVTAKPIAVLNAGWIGDREYAKKTPNPGTAPTFGLGSAPVGRSVPTLTFFSVRCAIFSQLIKDLNVGWARGPRTVVGSAGTRTAPKMC